MVFAIVLNANSAEAVVLAAFEAHFLKDLTRAQLNSALKSLCSTEEQNNLSGKEKSKLVIPVATQLIAKNYVRIEDGIKLGSITRDDVQKLKSI